MTERERIAARARALAAMTVENGCSEQEAVTAAAKLADLLERYNMTLDEATLRESRFKRQDRVIDDDVGARLWKPASAIAKLTNTTYWSAAAGMPHQVTFFGFEHEVEIAGYLLSICETAMRGGYRRTMCDAALLVPAKRRTRVTQFLDGMADRLAERLLEMIPPKPTGTGLVVLHHALVTAEMKRHGIELQDKRQQSSRDWGAYSDGRAAADAVALNKGVGSRPAMGGMLR